MAKRIFDKQRNVLQTSGAASATFDMPIPSNTTTGFIAKIIAKDTVANIGAMFHQVGTISNNGGVAALDGAVVSLGSIVNVGIAGITAVMGVNSTNLRLTVTGIVLKDIDWQFEIELIHN